MSLQNTRPCFVNIRSLSIPKSPDTRNEDAYTLGPNCVVVADGVTTKTSFSVVRRIANRRRCGAARCGLR